MFLFIFVFEKLKLVSNVTTKFWIFLKKNPGLLWHMLQRAPTPWAETLLHVSSEQHKW